MSWREIGIKPEPKGSGRGSRNAPAMQKKEISPKKRKEPPATFNATATSYPEPMERISTLQMPERCKPYTRLHLQKWKNQLFFWKNQVFFQKNQATPPPVKCKPYPGLRWKNNLTSSTPKKQKQEI